MNFSLTTFDKSGKLLQIEYALNRVAQGKMALGIKATNGVVIASDKKVASVLVDAEEYQKIQSITPSTGIYRKLFHFLTYRSCVLNTSSTKIQSITSYM
jgi:20S proteasome alpha/beta subunit